MDSPISATFVALAVLLVAAQVYLAWRKSGEGALGSAQDLVPPFPGAKGPVLEEP